MEKYLSLSEWCALHGRNPGNTRRLIAEGRIPAEKIGNQWVIAAGTPPPPDLRVKSGKYRGWRKNTGKESE